MKLNRVLGLLCPIGLKDVKQIILITISHKTTGWVVYEPGKGGLKKSRPRLTVQRYREAPETDKLIEAHSMTIEWAFTTISVSLKIRGFLHETHSEILHVFSI